MRSRISKTTRFVLAGAACVAFCTATASADIVTFWKTDTCPDFGGTKVAIASELGHMEAPVSDEATMIANSSKIVTHGIGGAYCVLDNVPKTAHTSLKGSAIFNADITNQPGDPAFDCVVCQYQNKINIPAMSLLGTLILMAGLLTAGAYQIGKKQRREAVA